MKRISRRAYKIPYFFLFLILAGGLSRFWMLGRESLWYDEARGLEIARSVGSLHLENLFFFTPWTSPHPAFYYLILHYWIKLVGESEVALRALSAVFGVALIVVVYYVGKYAISRKTGMIASIILLINPAALYYSQEARMYTLVPLLTLITTYYLYLLLTKQNIKYFALYTATSVILLYTDYLGVLTLLSHCLFFFIFFLQIRDKKNLLTLCLAYSVIACLYIPWLPNALLKINWHAIAWIKTPVVLDGPLDTLIMIGLIPMHLSKPDFINILYSTHIADRLYILLWVWCGLVLIIGLIASLREILSFTGLVAIVSAVPLLIYFISIAITPIYHFRHAFVHFPEVALVMATGFLAMETYLSKRLNAPYHRLILPFLFLPLLAANLVGSHQVYAEDTKENWRDIAQHIESLGNDRPIVIYEGYLVCPFKYYYRGSAQIIPLGKLTTLKTAVPSEEFLLILSLPIYWNSLADFEKDFIIEGRDSFLRAKIFSVKRKDTL